MKCKRCDGTGKIEVWELLSMINGADHVVGILTQDMYGNRPTFYHALKRFLVKLAPEVAAIKTGHIVCAACRGEGRAA